MEKINLCIIFGGQSSEHDISLISASSVINNLDENKYNIIKLGITKSGAWFLYNGSTEDIKNNTWENNIDNQRAFITPDTAVKGITVLKNDLTYEIMPVDVCFGVLHGLFGEDGTIQGLFELANIPYVGPNVFSSSVCMDKVYTKMILDFLKIKQANWLYFTKYELDMAFDTCIEKVENFSGYPVFVKPSNAGSSIGITKAKDRESLIFALKNAAKYDAKVIVEQAINAREIECSIIGSSHPMASVCGEIVTNDEFYDFDAKYKNATSKTVIPADIDFELMDDIRMIAIKAYTCLGCTGLSRVDFFLEKDTNTILLNEINTIPGFTDISMYPKMLEASGMSYKNQLDKLIELAIEYMSQRRALLNE